MDQLLAEIKTEALNFYQAVKTAALNVFNESVKAVTPVVETEVLTAMSQMKTLAVNTVAMLAQGVFGNLTGAQKSAVAVSTVLSGAAQSGVTMLESDAVTLVQASYNALADAKPAS